MQNSFQTIGLIAALGFIGGLRVVKSDFVYKNSVLESFGVNPARPRSRSKERFSRLLNRKRK